MSGTCPGAVPRPLRRATATATLILAALVLSLASCSGLAEQRATRALEIYVAIDPTALRDGVYSGAYAYSGLSYTATVTLSGGRIVDIVVDSTGAEAPRESWALPLVPRVIAENSLDVEVVAGATTSSKAILKAIENALRKAPLR
ncbi:MAG: FMN-binding protein [Spirochaetales bacterium]|nr:FMN-binding protein [Spirochaetales bacterium]